MLFYAKGIPYANLSNSHIHGVILDAHSLQTFMSFKYTAVFNLLPCFFSLHFFFRRFFNPWIHLRLSFVLFFFSLTFFSLTFSVLFFRLSSFRNWDWMQKIVVIAFQFIDSTAQNCDEIHHKIRNLMANARMRT